MHKTCKANVNLLYHSDPPQKMQTNLLKTTQNWMSNAFVLAINVRFIFLLGYGTKGPL